jgi:stress-induced-phosphoprotein 1
MSDKANEFKAQGNAAFQSGNFEEAVKLFTQAIELNPNDHVFFSNRSGAYASLKNYEKALEDATTCVNLRPNWAKGYQRKGLAEFFLDDIPAAVETYKKGLEI